MKHVVAIASLLLAVHAPALAQITSAPDGTNTGVNQAGNTLNITGGTQAGSNLFHSFQQFGLNAGQIANFLSNPAIANILGRVTGGEASIINGRIQVTGSNANLFLMNPAGIIFGANASLDVPGSFTATTANGIRLDGNWFNATGSNNYGTLTGTPNALGFTMPQPGAIINAANLAVSDGNTLTLVGGTVINTGSLAAPSGQIIVAAVPGENLVRLTTVGGLLSLDIRPPTVAESQPAAWTSPIANLPLLLTGGGLGSATGVRLNPDGSVSLVSSGARVNAGDVVVAAIASDPTNSSTQPRAVVISAANNLTTGDIQARSGGRALIDLSARGNIQTGALSSDAVVISAANNLTTGDIQARSGGRALIDLSARGNIQTGALSSDGEESQSGIILSSTGGNITVNTLFAIGSAGGSRGIDIFAAGVFQAEGASGSFSTGLQYYLLTDPDFLPFLANKTGATPADLTTILNATNPSNVRMTINAPVSIRTARQAPIRIRYAGGTGNVVTLANGITVQGGDAPFVIGPDTTPGVGDRYLPISPVSDYANFLINPFSLVLNESYTLKIIPDGISGTAGAIARSRTDGTLTYSVQNRVLGILPSIVLPSISDDKTSTRESSQNLNQSTVNLNAARLQERDGQIVQRQLTSQRQDAVCETLGAIASTTTSEARSPDNIRNPCTTAKDDAQILKILGDDSGKVKN